MQVKFVPSESHYIAGKVMYKKIEGPAKAGPSLLRSLLIDSVLHKINLPILLAGQVSQLQFRKA